MPETHGPGGGGLTWRRRVILKIIPRCSAVDMGDVPGVCVGAHSLGTCVEVTFKVYLGLWDPHWGISVTVCRACILGLTLGVKLPSGLEKRL